MAKSRFQQYMLIGIGIMVAVGFSGVFTYGNMINTGPSNSDSGDQQQINATLPNQTYSNQSFGLSIRQQAYLAYNEQVVFVNALYDNSSETYSGLETLPEEMNNRVYVNLINNSDSPFASRFNLDIPSAFIIGDQPSRTRRGTLPYTYVSAAPNRSAIKDKVCQAMRDPGNLAATCFT